MSRRMTTPQAYDDAWKSCKETDSTSRKVGWKSSQSASSEGFHVRQTRHQMMSFFTHPRSQAR